MYFVILGSLAVFIFGGAIIGILLEKKEYNNGYCPHCGKKLLLFDTDSQGGRGYICEECGYCAWVSYPFVDKRL